MVIMPAAPVIPATLGPAVIRDLDNADDGQDEIDDGWAYMPDNAGRFVLADLGPDGRMVPINLIDQRFRALAAGLCSVYGCLNPAQRMLRGWPVCTTCHRELSDTPAQ
jgi:hypothetical protein